MSAPWIELLRSEVAASSMTAVAKRVGISRTAVSLCLSGKYGAKTERVAAKVLAILGESVDCPAMGQIVAKEKCRDFCTRRAPTHNPVAMQHWRTCQRCPNNPKCSQRENPHAN